MHENKQIQNLIKRCLEGDEAAWAGFQQQFGEIIHGYPIRVYRVPPDDASDFYIYVFEDGRIFRRVRSYEGRAPFQAFLLGFVLDALFIDWRRTTKKLDTVGLDDVGEAVGATTDHDTTDHDTTGPGDAVLDGLLGGIDPNKAIVMKLLHAEDAEFTPEDVQLLAKRSGRPVIEVLDTIERLRNEVRDGEAGTKEIEGRLDAIHSWIQLYEKRLHRIRQERSAAVPGSNRDKTLGEQEDTLLGRIDRRRQARENLVAKTRSHRAAVPYKEIADILNTTVGNVGSQVTRLRKELQKRSAKRSAS